MCFSCDSREYIEYWLNNLIVYLCIILLSYRVLSGERAPEGESEMLPSTSVWSYSSWWPGLAPNDLDEYQKIEKRKKRPI